MLGTSPRRFLAGFASVVVATGLLGLAVPTAHAAEVDLGDLTVTPTSGPATDFITVNTPQACPAGTVNFKVSLNGPGITGTQDNNLNGVSSYASATPLPTGTGVTVQAANTLKDLFQANGVTAPSGQYVINFRCQNGNGGTVYGDFLATINLVAGANAFEGTYTYVPPAPAGVATTTTLAQPATPIKVGTTTTLTATVSESAAAGTVQFKDGATNLGAPVAVVSGTATKSGVALVAGNRSLTAVFTSADTNAFLSSTSTATSVVVAGVPVITGTAAVGKTLTCATSTGGTQTFAWLVNGVASTTAKSKTAVVPAAWYAKSVACRATFTVNATSVVQTSAAKKIALGAKLVATTKPKVLGTARVGRILTCAKGTWTPAPTGYKYQWLRGTTPLSGKVASTYKTVAGDKNKLVTCKVTALKTGYASGVALAPARKIL
ncbi:MAG: Ig-like domain-containing protein [Propionibacteriales bacterium]|nr:Ig-like domain-containing protein [Propionibacteriales bacterium]